MKRVFALIISLLTILCLACCNNEVITDTSNDIYPIESPTSQTQSAENNTINSEPDETSSLTTSFSTESEYHEESQPIHIHEYSNPTCTEPATCNCGETTGQALGHNYSPATCFVPKTCTVCNKTEGDVLTHSYTDGKCVYCGAKEPQKTDDGMVWIPTKSGKKYHKSSTCSNMKNPKNVTLHEAINSGFTACGKCYK